MRTGARKESTESRGLTTWSDGLHPFDGARLSDGSVSATEELSDRIGRAGRGGDDAVSKTSWFDPVEPIVTEEFLSDCPGGVCPVPWAVKEEVPVVKEDKVNHPSHYVGEGIECIEAIEAALTNEEFRGYCKGNCLKYIWRERHKGGTESLKKAQWYLKRLIELDEAQNG
jgi:hypothetical protein